MARRFDPVKIASESNVVYKEECVLSFDIPYMDGGLYTNLSTFESFGEHFVAIDRERTCQKTYLHQKFKRIGVKKQDNNEINKIAIGMEGGFNDEQVLIEKNQHIVLFDGSNEEIFELDDVNLPENVRESAQSVLNHQGHYVQEQVKSWQQEFEVSQYAFDLIQLPREACAPVSGNPSTWVCSSDTCDKRENLWMNLSDGFVGCGRRNFDGTGGCGEALRHFEETGRNFPLAVKLGTITPSGGGDVFSYAEDDMVLDPNLGDHLRHFGIKIDQLTKTEKTTNELEVELNKNWDFDSIMEEGKNLQSISGPGYLGLTNLGNSCYMNSVFQLLLAIPEIKERYLDLKAIASTSPATDLPTQFSKLVKALNSNRYVGEELRPLMIRSLVGKGHEDFSTNQQQDAMEYLMHFLDLLNKSEKSIARSLDRGDSLGSIPSSNLFNFSFEDRIECTTSHKVKYISREENALQLNIPLHHAVNAEEVQEFKRQKVEESDSKRKPVVPDVPFSACIDLAFSTESIEGFFSPALGRKGPATKTVRFKTYPKYLFVQMRRYYVSEDWTPKKMDVVVTVPETFRLGSFKSKGQQDDELSFPDDSSSEVSTALEPDANLVAELMSMGFSENGCKRAALATSNAPAAIAMEWIFSHMEDDNFNSPIETTSKSTKQGTSCPPEMIDQFKEMGFSMPQVLCALKHTKDNADLVPEWLFSNMDNLEQLVKEFESEQTNSTQETTNPFESPEADEYELLGFISHMGGNTQSGHYVAHLKKDGQWIFFNDSKVAISETPPFGAGYIYLFHRK